jgi:FKBP-type peptidyl-prolyl cis-trans isomerase
MNSRLIILALLPLAALASCQQQDAATTYSNQEEAIDKYVYSKFDSSAVHHTNGVTRVTLTKAAAGADSLEMGDTAYFYWAGYLFSNGPGTLFSTDDPKVSTAYADTIPAKVKLGETAMIKGLENGLAGIKKGEESYIIFSGKYGFGSDNVYNITKLSALIYHVRLTDIIKEDKKNPQ